MSVTEAAGHALVKLREDSSLAEMAANVDNIPACKRFWA